MTKSIFCDTPIAQKIVERGDSKSAAVTIFPNRKSLPYSGLSKGFPAEPEDRDYRSPVSGRRCAGDRLGRRRPRAGGGSTGDVRGAGRPRSTKNHQESLLHSKEVTRHPVPGTHKGTLPGRADRNRNGRVQGDSDARVRRPLRQQPIRQRFAEDHRRFVRDVIENPTAQQ